MLGPATRQARSPPHRCPPRRPMRPTAPGAHHWKLEIDQAPSNGPAFPGNLRPSKTPAPTNHSKEDRFHDPFERSSRLRRCQIRSPAARPKNTKPRARGALDYAEPLGVAKACKIRTYHGRPARAHGQDARATLYHRRNPLQTRHHRLHILRPKQMHVIDQLI
jgi:hypothetical protein